MNKIIKIDHFKNLKSFYPKILELFSNIITLFLKNNLYYQLALINSKEKIISNKFSSFLENFLVLSMGDLYNLINNDVTNFKKNYLINNEQLLNVNIIDKTISIFGEIPVKIGANEYNIRSILNKFLEITQNLHNNEVKYKKKIPDEFIDPILLVEITEPIELPETKNILNKDTILNHLIFYNTNPFSGNLLNKEELINYNKSEEVKERCNQFLNKIKEWKNKNKI